MTNEKFSYGLRFFFAVSGLLPLFVLYIIAILQSGLDMFTIDGLKKTLMFKFFYYPGIVIFYLSFALVIWRLYFLFSIRKKYLVFKNEGIFFEGKNICALKEIDIKKTNVRGKYIQYLDIYNKKGEIKSINITPVNCRSELILCDLRRALEEFHGITGTQY